MIHNATAVSVLLSLSCFYREQSQNCFLVLFCLPKGKLGKIQLGGSLCLAQYNPRKNVSREIEINITAFSSIRNVPCKTTCSYTYTNQNKWKRKRKTQQNAYIVCRCCRFARLIKRHVLRRVLRVSTHKARAEGTTCPHIACSRIKITLFKQKRSCRRVECSLLTSAFHVYAKYGFTFISILQLMHCICLLICAMEKKNKVYLFPKISRIYIDNYCFYFLFYFTTCGPIDNEGLT